MPLHRTASAAQPGAPRRMPFAPERGRKHELVRLASRLLVAQAVACAALGVGYGRRNLPFLLAAVAIATAVCGLAVLARSGSHGAWLAAVSAESALVAAGLFMFASSQYLGGTLLAIITLGVLLRPSVSAAFAGQVAPGGADSQPAMADGAAELQGSAAAP